MATRSARVGVHGRNDYWHCKFEESDYQLIREARIEHVKMMISDQAARPEVLRNVIGVCHRLKEINPDMDFVVRLFDAEVRDGRHPTPQVFANRFAPIMNGVHERCPYVFKFEILNEPNHTGGLGGWGPEADKARDFSRWFLETYDRLKAVCHWASLGFPGLVPHHGLRPDAPQLGADLDWLVICRDAVGRADWLGVHCYWQNRTYTEGNHLHPDWGLRFKAYHQKFPDKIIEITEFGNSNGQSNYPVVPDKIAQEYVRYYQELFNYPYLNSASSFIMSSPDPTWGDQGFTWRKENGEFWPVVRLVGAMERPPLVPAGAERYFPETRHTVKGVFLKALNRYGLEVCGYPLTEQFDEAGLPSQYFERVAMEEYEEGKVRFKAMSHEALRARQTVAQLQREAQSLRQQAMASQATVAPLQQEVQRLRQQATASQETMIQLRRQVDTLRQQAVAPQATVAPLQREVQRLRQQAAASQETIIQLRRQVDTLHQQAVPPQATVAPLQREVQRLRQQAAASQETIIQLRRQVDTLRQQAMAPQATVASLQQEAQRLRQQAAASQETIIQLRRQVDTLRQQLVAATTTTPAAKPAATTPPATPPVITPPPMEDITTSLRRHPVKRFDRRTLDQIKYLVIQHSVLPGDFPPEKIADYLVEKRQWPSIGYHFYITSDGTIYQTNRLEMVGYFAGANARYNPLGVCVCFAGDFTSEVPTTAQLNSGGKLLAFLMQELHLPIESVRGQKEFVATQSPGQQWDSGQRWRNLLLAEVRAAQA